MTNQPAGWMTIREAALALGVSELTIRRRIKDGRMAHRLENGKYYVDLNEQAETPPSSAHGAVPREHMTTQSDRPARALPTHAAPPQPDVPDRLPAQNGPAAHSPGGEESRAAGNDRAASVPQIDLDAWMAEHSRLAEIAGRARLLEDQLAQLSVRHEELQAGMVSLAGRNGWLESKLEERESEIKLLTDQHPRAPWWRRLFGA